MKPEIKERVEKIRKGEVPEGYKKTKVGIIPDDWDVVPTNKVIKTIKNPVNVEPNTEYREIGIRSHGKGIFHKKLVQGNKLGNKRVFWVEEKCFIVNIVFAWEQAVAITSENERGLIASHRFPMYKPKNDLISLHYLLAFYQSPRGKFQLNLASPGGAGRNKTLGQKEFAQSLIPSPTFYEQKKIVEILSTWNQAIELKMKLIEMEKEFKRGLMQKLLTGNVRFPEFTDEWGDVPLNQIFDFKGGFTASRNDLGDKGIAYLHYGDIHKGSKNFIDVKKELLCIPKIDLNIDKIPQKNLLKDGYVVFADASEDYEGIGKSVTVFNPDEIPFINGLHTIVAVPKNGTLNKNYSRFFLMEQSIRKQIMFYAQGISVLGISKGHLKKIVAHMPSDIEQEKIAFSLKNLDDNIELLNTELNQLKKQKRGLMQLLLTGIVRVEVD